MSRFCENRANKCLSRMKGNFHVRFLGGKGVAILPTYPLVTTDEQKAALVAKAEKQADNIVECIKAL